MYAGSWPSTPKLLIEAGSTNDFPNEFCYRPLWILGILIGDNYCLLVELLSELSAEWKSLTVGILHDLTDARFDYFLLLSGLWPTLGSTV